ncbi:MAG TPA: MbnP family protein [Saprospiraceae bacterium]|nr:MbnP family protein [Saprospiraceae bacterium]
MKKLLFFIAALFFLSACGEKDPDIGLVDFSVQFNGVFDNSPLRMYEQTYAYEDGMDLRFQLFQFYVSDLSLIRSENNAESTVQLAEIELVSFADIQTPDEAAEGITLSFEDVPAGNYSGIKMGLGVSADLNATQPGDYAPPHPLDNHYWSWARGYVFTKVEGNADLDGDGTFEQKLTFHIGENEYYRELVINQAIEVSAGGKITLEVDLANVLKNNTGTYLNFREVTQDHTNDPEVANMISDNLQEAINFPQQ